MAPCIISFVVFLFLALRATFSLPVFLDVKKVQLSNSENQYTEETPVLYTKTISNFETEVKLVQNLSTETVLNDFEGVEAYHSKRIKRQIIKHGICAKGQIHAGNVCVDQKEKEYDDYNDVGDSSDDK